MEGTARGWFLEKEACLLVPLLALLVLDLEVEPKMRDERDFFIFFVLAGVDFNSDFFSTEIILMAVLRCLVEVLGLMMAQALAALLSRDVNKLVGAGWIIARGATLFGRPQRLSSSGSYIDCCCFSW